MTAVEERMMPEHHSNHMSEDTSGNILPWFSLAMAA